jgi:hypothetical protein
MIYRPHSKASSSSSNLHTILERPPYLVISPSFPILRGSFGFRRPAHPYNRRKSFVVHCASSPNDCLLIRCGVGRVLTIDNLPDDVLREIFDSYVVGYQDLDFIEVVFRGQDTNLKRKIESWQSLVQVCRRWRDLVLGSPRRLNLQICCRPSRSARKSLDVWPALPLLIQGGVSERSVNSSTAVA